MPWTFAHPAAILPLRSLCPARLDFAALVVGSLVPDLGYYLHRNDLATFAHGFAGSFLACLPSGLILYALVYLLREPLCFALPQPHRGALAASGRDSWSARVGLGTLALSVLLGAWTHLAWDAFTHREGWAVQHLALLREPLFRVGSTGFPAYYLLQQASTIAGSLILLAAYRSWLKSRRVPVVLPAESGDVGRHLLWASTALVALAVAAPMAFRVASGFDGWMAVRVLLFQTAVNATAIFLSLWAAGALAFYALRRPV